METAENTMELVEFTGYLPKINNDVLDQVSEAAEDVCLWAKPQAGGFLLGTETYQAITGLITNVDPYFVKWTAGQPDKLHCTADQAPSDYEPRCDVTIMTADGLTVGVSLAKSSYLYSLAPYIKSLRAMGLDPTEVITRFTCKEVRGKLGTFVSVQMAMVKRLETQPSAQPKKVYEDDVPF
jgi:hypothetical protein